jgi:hypothetical protein
MVTFGDLPVMTRQSSGLGSGRRSSRSSRNSLSPVDSVIVRDLMEPNTGFLTTIIDKYIHSHKIFPMVLPYNAEHHFVGEGGMALSTEENEKPRNFKALKDVHELHIAPNILKYFENPRGLPPLYIIVGKYHASLLVIYKNHMYGMGFVYTKADFKTETLIQANPYLSKLVIASPDHLVTPKTKNPRDPSGAVYKYPILDAGFLTHAHITRIESYLKTFKTSAETLVKFPGLESLMPKEEVATVNYRKLPNGSINGSYSFELNQNYSFYTNPILASCGTANCTSALEYIFSESLSCGDIRTAGIVSNPGTCVSLRSFKPFGENLKSYVYEYLKLMHAGKTRVRQDMLEVLQGGRSSRRSSRSRRSSHSSRSK